MTPTSKLISAYMLLLENADDRTRQDLLAAAGADMRLHQRDKGQLQSQAMLMTARDRAARADTVPAEIADEPTAPRNLLEMAEAGITLKYPPIERGSEDDA